MRLGDYGCSIMSGGIVAGRMIELGAPAPVAIGTGFVIGGLAAVLVSVFDHMLCEERKPKKKRKTKKKRDVRRVRRADEKPCGCIQHIYTPAEGYRRCLDIYLAEQERLRRENEQKKQKPVHKLTGVLAEDFALLPEDERRSFFEDCA